MGRSLSPCRFSLVVVVVDLSSYDQPRMPPNTGGNIDISFGPKAPASTESNWIWTRGKHTGLSAFYRAAVEFRKMT
jgi:hypothetical protein